MHSLQVESGMASRGELKNCTGGSQGSFCEGAVTESPGGAAIYRVRARDAPLRVMGHPYLNTQASQPH